jgi:SAM-dependent methyltransferase
MEDKNESPMAIEDRLRTNTLLAKQAFTNAQRALFKHIFPNDDFDFVINQWRNQNLFFALDMMTVLGPELHQYSHGTELTYLDVGAGPGFGTEFIADLFSDPNGAVRLKCHALELSNQWERMYPALNQNLSVSTNDLFEVPNDSFDIVTSSHVVEHLDPEFAIEFISKMKKVARKISIIICPYEEPEPRHPSHVHSIDKNFIKRANPTRYEVIRSFGWNAPHKQSRVVAMLFLR